MSMINRKNKAAYRIIVCIITAMLATSPFALSIRADAAEEESSEDKDGKKQEKDRKEDASEAPAGGSTKGSAEAASIEEPKTPGEEEPGKEEPAHPESSVREALDNERSMVADDDILLVRIGYEFDDGSFDEWIRGTGFIVGPRYILTRQSLIDTASDSTLFARIVKERGEAYRRVGVNLLTGEEAAKHVRYYVNDREGNRLEVTDLSMKSGLGLVVTKEAMDIPACVFTKVNVDDLAEGTVIHTKTAAETGEQFTVRTFEGTVYIDEEQTAGFAFKMDAQGGAPIGAPVYDDHGHVIGLIASDSQIMQMYTGALSGDRIVMQSMQSVMPFAAIFGQPGTSHFVMDWEQTLYSEDCNTRFPQFVGNSLQSRSDSLWFTAKAENAGYYLYRSEDTTLHPTDVIADNIVDFIVTGGKEAYVISNGKLLRCTAVPDAGEESDRRVQSVTAAEKADTLYCAGNLPKGESAA